MLKWYDCLRFLSAFFLDVFLIPEVIPGDQDLSAKEQRDLKKGVKGPASHLTTLPDYNIILDTLTDTMHQLMNFVPTVVCLLLF